MIAATAMPGNPKYPYRRVDLPDGRWLVQCIRGRSPSEARPGPREMLRAWRMIAGEWKELANIDAAPSAVRDAGYSLR